MPKVPDTDSFSMQDVVDAGVAGDDLQELFANANPDGFDPAYVGDKTNLLNFRNYDNEPIGLLEIPFTETFDNNNNNWVLLDGAVIADGKVDLPAVDARCEINVNQLEDKPVSFTFVNAAGNSGTLNIGYGATGNTGSTTPSTVTFDQPAGINKFSLENFAGAMGYLTVSCAYALDPDAQDFITRAGITDQTQKDAINELTLALKAIETSGGSTVWDDLEFFYPFVGGNAAAHAENLIDSSLTITWAGTITHDANGIKGSGSGSYGDTGYIVTSGSCSYGVYTRSGGTSANNEYVMGYSDPQTSCTIIASRASDNKIFSFFQSATGSGCYYRLESLSTRGIGHFQFNTDTCIQDNFQDGVELSDIAQLPPLTGGGYPSSLWVAGRNAGGTYDKLYSDRQISSFYFSSRSWVDSAVIAVHNAVLAFHTALGRNV